MASLTGALALALQAGKAEALMHGNRTMQTWLRSVVDTMLGRVSGKTSRPDTATAWRWTQISATAANQRFRANRWEASGTMATLSKAGCWPTLTSLRS